MLSKIHISNYVLISKLEVDFKPGFTVITGETGAGKSIILGALSLILGERANTASKGSPDKKIIAEGEFNIENYNLESFFKLHDLDFEPLATSLRREIVPSGKSRAFINDTPVSISVLKALGQKLVDIHSQHENQLLLTANYQLQFLDAFAGLQKKVAAFSIDFEKWKKLSITLNELIENEKKARVEEDYIRFQLTEIEEAGLEKLNFDELQSELEVLDNADAIKMGLSGASHLISDGDSNALSMLKEAISSVEDSANLSENFVPLVERLNSVVIELDDINTDIEYNNGVVESNPEKADYIRKSIDGVNSLLFKHGLKNVEELRALESELQGSLTKIDGFTEEIARIELQRKTLDEKMQKSARTISDKRKKTAPKLEKLIADGLHNLGMPNARLVINLEEKSEFSVSGIDEITLQFSANKGFEPQALEKVASGGERSRLMLVLKKIHASVASTPTLILDEIDTGISGDVAAKTAQMLSDMATDSQIISITHLPQVAGKANHHQEVSKSTEGEKTTTSLRTLSNDERRIEIARMLSGENITEAALENADHLMK